MCAGADACNWGSWAFLREWPQTSSTEVGATGTSRCGWKFPTQVDMGKGKRGVSP